MSIMKLTPRRSEKAKTNAKWTSSDDYRSEHDRIFTQEAPRQYGEKAPYCAECGVPIRDGKWCYCGCTSWVYR